VALSKVKENHSLFTDGELQQILEWSGFEQKKGYRGMTLHGVCPVHDGADNPNGFTAYLDTSRHAAGAFICWTKSCLNSGSGNAKGEDAFGFVARILDRNLAYQEGIPLEMLSTKQRHGFGHAKKKIEQIIERRLADVFSREEVGYHDYFKNQVDQLAKKRPVEMRILAEETLKEYRHFHPYMLERGYTQEVLDHFEIGYSPKESRVTIPMRDVSGELIAVARRLVDDKLITKDNPKYLHHAFSKSEFLYNLHRVREIILADGGLTKLIHPGILVLESQMDVLRLTQYGFPLAVAVGGSALSKHQGMLLESLTDQVTIIRHSDAAGEKLVQSAKAVLGKYVTVYAASVPHPYKDIGDIRGEHGIDLTHYILEQRKRV
jgi:Toprim-like